AGDRCAAAVPDAGRRQHPVRVRDARGRCAARQRRDGAGRLGHAGRARDAQRRARPAANPELSCVAGRDALNDMGVLEAIAIFAAGVAAGTINSVVGSGTLITFPVLLAFGYAPVVANVSNTVGLVPGNASGAVGYRRELAGQRARAIPLMCMSLVGAGGGAALLLTLPASAFKAIVPVFIAVALILIVFQPRIAKWLEARGGSVTDRAGPLASAGVFAAGVYGGYFGAAQ